MVFSELASREILSVSERFVPPVHVGLVLASGRRNFVFNEPEPVSCYEPSLGFSFNYGSVQYLINGHIKHKGSD